MITASNSMASKASAFSQFSLSVCLFDVFSISFVEFFSPLSRSFEYKYAISCSFAFQITLLFGSSKRLMSKTAGKQIFIGQFSFYIYISMFSAPVPLWFGLYARSFSLFRSHFFVLFVLNIFESFPETFYCVRLRSGGKAGRIWSECCLKERNATFWSSCVYLSGFGIVCLNDAGYTDAHIILVV